MTVSDQTLLGRLRRHAAERPEQPAYTFIAPEQTEHYTWAEAWAEALRGAAYLAEQGLQPGNVVAVMAQSPRDQILGFLSVIAFGGCPTILSYPSPKQSLSRFSAALGPILRAAVATAILCDREFFDSRDQWASSIDAAGTGILRFAPASFDRLLDRAATAADGDLLFFQFSSGTTGLRKGVQVSNAMLAQHSAAIARALEIGSQDVFVSWLPLYHDMGLVASFLMPTFLGAHSVHMSPFDWLRDPSLLFRAISRFRGTLSWLPNFAYSFCASRVDTEQLASLDLDLSSVRALVNCGEPVKVASHRQFIERFARLGIRPEVLQCSLGMAETVCGCTQTLPGSPPRVDRVDRAAFVDNHRARPAAPDARHDLVVELMSSGPPVEGIEIRIDGAKDDRELGEIHVRGDFLFSGYVGPAATNAGVFTDDGWYRTGDLGYLAEGELFVTGRKKDLIIHRGANIYPTDVEEIIERVQGVKSGRVVAFGIQADEQETTEDIVALAEVSPGFQGGRRALAARIHQVVEDAGITLRDVVVCEPGVLQKSTSGKLSRSGNRRLYEQDQLGVIELAGTRIYPSDVQQALAEAGFRRTAAFAVGGDAEPRIVVCVELDSARGADCSWSSLHRSIEQRLRPAIGSVAAELRVVAAGEIPMTADGRVDVQMCQDRYVTGLTRAIGADGLALGARYRLAHGIAKVLAERIAALKTTSPDEYLGALDGVLAAHGIDPSTFAEGGGASTVIELWTPQGMYEIPRRKAWVDQFRVPALPAMLARTWARTEAVEAEYLACVRTWVDQGLLEIADEWAPEAPPSIREGAALERRERARSAELVLLLNGGGTRMLFSLDFITRTGLSERNMVLFHDVTRRNYADGISLELPSMNELIAYCRGVMASSTAIRRTLVVGISAGAPAAMVLGHHLGVDGVWALAPPMTSYQSPSGKGFDVAQTLRTGNGVTEYQLFYCEGAEPDATVARSLGGLPGVHLHPVPGSTHEIMEALLHHGRLESMFPDPEYVAGAPAPASASLVTVEAVIDVVKRVTTQLPRECGHDTPIRSCFDSLSVMQLLAAFDRTFGIHVRSRDLGSINLDTPRTLTESIIEYVHESSVERRQS